MGNTAHNYYAIVSNTLKRNFSQELCYADFT